ncbi:MAG: glycosyltransferase family 2 protein [Deltaproteobacteria bacterium]|nr:glycosyltransferase family 2 protein [Deltaproteobacteria bacterium]
MHLSKTVAVVVPAYNESRLIEETLSTIPGYVDTIIVVDDASTDHTGSIVKTLMESDPRIVLVVHPVNQGVGGAIVTGYKEALNREVGVTAVMAGDAQMDPDDLLHLVEPVCRDEVGYTKGNRLFTGEAWKMIPKVRYIGNAFLSLLTKGASGYWHVADSQCGYTAISKQALQMISLDAIHKRYGMPNDMLVKLNIENVGVRDVPVKPIYNIGEASGIRIWKHGPLILLLLLRGFVRRLFDKYVIKDFHPLVFFYFLGSLLTPAGIVFGLYLFAIRITGTPVAPTSALFASFLFISGLQSLFFAMWFDMEYNKALK